jgi:RNase P/RNase MRP subunit p30
MKKAYYDLLVSGKEAREKILELGFSEAPETKEASLGELPQNLQHMTFVNGGELGVNRKVVRSPADVLLDAVSTHGVSVDSAVVQVAKDNGVTFAFSLRPFLKHKGHRRIKLLLNARNAVLLAKKMEARILLTSGARNLFEIRNPAQLVAFGTFLGMTHEQAIWSVTEVPKYLIEKMEARKPK